LALAPPEVSEPSGRGVGAPGRLQKGCTPASAPGGGPSHLVLAEGGLGIMPPSVPLRGLASAGPTRLEVPLRLRGRPAPSLKVRRGTGPNAATRWVAHLAQCGRYRPGAFAHGRVGRQAIATSAPLRSGILHALRGLLSGSSPLSWSSPLWVPSLNHLPSTAPLGADSLISGSWSPTHHCGEPDVDLPSHLF